MKFKPFDLKAAQAGEPIVRYYPSEWDSFPVLFVGVTKSGLIAVEPPEGTAVYRYSASELRMAPKPTKLYIVTRWINGEMVSSMTCTTEIGRDAHVKDTAEPYKVRVVTIEVDAP